MSQLVPLTSGQSLIYQVRGFKVMLDNDLANLYGVETFNLTKAVRRNIDRFPGDLMFRLTREEYDSLRFQIGILKKGQHSKYLPYMFTQEGVAMLSSVLRSRRAVQVNVAIMRAFVKFREKVMTNKVIGKKLGQIELQLNKHNNKFKIHGTQIRHIFSAIRRMMLPAMNRKKKIGFIGA